VKDVWGIGCAQQRSDCESFNGIVVLRHLFVPVLEKKEMGRFLTTPPTIQLDGHLGIKHCWVERLITKAGLIQPCRTQQTRYNYAIHFTS
jgi:hypothetical protein